MVWKNVVNWKRILLVTSIFSNNKFHCPQFLDFCLEAQRTFFAAVFDEGEELTNCGITIMAYFFGLTYMQNASFEKR